MTYEINRNLSESKFEAINDGCVIGSIEYCYPDKQTITIMHTNVDTEFEGMGIAASLNKALLDNAIESSLMVIPLCSYSIAYINRHPEYAKLLKT